jgi:hypothetical protein
LNQISIRLCQMLRTYFFFLQRSTQQRGLLQSLTVKEQTYRDAWGSQGYRKNERKETGEKKAILFPRAKQPFVDTFLKALKTKDIAILRIIHARNWDTVPYMGVFWNKTLSVVFRFRAPKT